MQLYTKEVLGNLNSNHTAIDNFLSNSREKEVLGNDYNEHGIEESDNQVTVLEILHMFSEEQLLFIAQNLNAISNDWFGKYEQCLEIIENMLH